MMPESYYIDVRLSSKQPEKIVFADKHPCHSVNAEYMVKCGVGVSIVAPKAEYHNVSVSSWEDAKNLIKALERARDLGWLT